MSDNTNVLVVGGGVIGMCCAWRLAQRGLRVTLLERGACGSGASGASLGVLMPSPATKHGPVQMLQRASLRAFPDYVRELARATGIDAGYRRCGLLEVLPDAQRRRQVEHEVRVACAEWPFEGPDPVMTLVDDARLAALAPEITSEGWGARLCRLTALVDVARLLAALRCACVAAGVALREGVEVNEVLVEQGRARGVQCGDERRLADAVLIATGAWTGQLGPVVAERAPTHPVKGQALRLHAPRTHLDRIVKRRNLYLIPQADDDVLIGATSEPEAGFDPRPRAQGIAELSAAAVRLAASLAQASLLAMWSGFRPQSALQRPIMGAAPDVAGLYLATGHYKTGIGLSALVGRLMAELIVDGRASVDLAPFATVTPVE